MGHVTYFL